MDHGVDIYTEVDAVEDSLNDDVVDPESGGEFADCEKYTDGQRVNRSLTGFFVGKASISEKKNKAKHSSLRGRG